MSTTEVIPSMCIHLSVFQEASSHYLGLSSSQTWAWSWLFLEKMMERRTMLERSQGIETNKVMERNQGTKRNQLLWLGGLGGIKLWLVSVAVLAFYWCCNGESCPHSGLCHCLGDSCYCCALKYPVGQLGCPSSPFSPSALPEGPVALQGCGWDACGTMGGRLNEL